jgi:hypothetical protein
MGTNHEDEEIDLEENKGDQSQEKRGKKSDIPKEIEERARRKVIDQDSRQSKAQEEQHQNGDDGAESFEALRHPAELIFGLLKKTIFLHFFSFLGALKRNTPTSPF